MMSTPLNNTIVLNYGKYATPTTIPPLYIKFYTAGQVLNQHAIYRTTSLLNRAEGGLESNSKIFAPANDLFVWEYKRVIRTHIQKYRMKLRNDEIEYAEVQQRLLQQQEDQLKRQVNQERALELAKYLELTTGNGRPGGVRADDDIDGQEREIDVLNSRSKGSGRNNNADK
eukprot:UN07254